MSPRAMLPRGRYQSDDYLLQKPQLGCALQAPAHILAMPHGVASSTRRPAPERSHTAPAAMFNRSTRDRNFVAMNRAALTKGLTNSREQQNMWATGDGPEVVKRDTRSKRSRHPRFPRASPLESQAGDGTRWRSRTRSTAASAWKLTRSSTSWTGTTSSRRSAGAPAGPAELQEHPVDAHGRDAQQGPHAERGLVCVRDNV